MPAPFQDSGTLNVNNYDTVQSELEVSDDTDHSEDRQQFELQYYEVKAKFTELLHPVVDPLWSRHSYHSSESKKSNQTQGHTQAVLILSYQ
jgi:hypothetical protein